MFFYAEAHAIDRPDLTVPVFYPVNSNPEQIQNAYNEAEHQAALKRAAKSAGPFAVVLSCHEVSDTHPAFGPDEATYFRIP